MADNTQFTRALQLLEIMKRGHYHSLEDLRSRLDSREVPRTVQRTLVTMESALPDAVKLEWKKEEHGRLLVRLRTPFRMPEDLSPDEALIALLLAPFLKHLAGSRTGEMLEGMLRKLGQLTPSDGVFAQADLSDIQSAIWLRPITRNPVKIDPSGLLELIEAIVTQREIRVGLPRKDSGSTDILTLQPHALLQHDGVFRLLGWDPAQAAWRWPAAHHVQEFTVLETPFERQPGFHLDAIGNGRFGFWIGKRQKVRLNFSAEVKDRIKGRIWHSTQHLTASPNGRIRLTMTVGISQEFKEWILRWGPLVVVESPSTLRDEIRAHLQHAVSQYDENSASFHRALDD